jgi:hypothetical protein
MHRLGTLLASLFHVTLPVNAGHTVIGGSGALLADTADPILLADTGFAAVSGSAHRYNGRCPLHAGGRYALSCLPYDVFDADLGERRSNGRPSSVRPSSVLCESQRRLLSVYG